MENVTFVVDKIGEFSTFADQYAYGVYRQNQVMNQLVYVTDSERDAQRVANEMASGTEHAALLNEAVALKRQVVFKPLTMEEEAHLTSDPEGFMSNWRMLKNVRAAQLSQSMDLRDQMTALELQGYEVAKNHLVVQAVNKNDNPEVEGNPHTDIPGTDLALTYHLQTERDGEQAFALVTGSMVQDWGVSLEQFYRDAMESSQKKKPLEVVTLDEAAKIPPSEAPTVNAYVVGVEDKIRGAAAIFYPGVMDQLAEKLGGDYYVIPSSDHEMIAGITPDMDAASLNHHIAEINQTLKFMDDNARILSNHAYHYDAAAKKFEIATDFEERKGMEKTAERDLDAIPKKKLEEQLTEGIRSVLGSEEFKAWLTASAMAPWNKYSFRNALLIYLQNPGATYTAGYEDWKNYGRAVTQGAKGMKIFKPNLAYEKRPGGLAQAINSSLDKQLAAEPDKLATYSLGTSGLEFTKRAGAEAIGMKFNGEEKGFFTKDTLDKYLSKSVIGRLPVGYSVTTVFDVADTAIPEYLWMKKGFTKDEVALNQYGRPTTNKRGETRIINTPARQAKFKPEMDMSMESMDPEKSAVLYAALKSISEKNGIPVSEKTAAEDQNLADGASGYYNRQATEENPKGYIVILEDQTADKKCAVLIHEMAHSELHREPEKTAAEIGEEKLTVSLKEIQAEAVAYSVGIRYGLDMDTSSFKYLAAYAKGNELQDMQKSMTVIYNEANALSRAVTKELQEMGYSQELEKIPHESKENRDRDLDPMPQSLLNTFHGKNANFVRNQGEMLEGLKKELPDYLRFYKGNGTIMGILREQNQCADRIQEALDKIKDLSEQLDKAGTRQEQNAILKSIDIQKRNVEMEERMIGIQQDRFEEAEKRPEEQLRQLFRKDPERGLLALAINNPELMELPAAQQDYIAGSEYIRDTCTVILATKDQKQFVDYIQQRAKLVDRVIAENGTFVEVARCEKGGLENPPINSGAIMHPKAADNLVTQTNTELAVMFNEEREKNDWPYCRCEMTVFTKPENGTGLTSMTIGYNLGECSESLEQYLHREYRDTQLEKNFTEALAEEDGSRKILLNDRKAPVNPPTKEAVEEKSKSTTGHTMSKEAWKSKMDDKKAARPPKEESTKGHQHGNKTR